MPLSHTVTALFVQHPFGGIFDVPQQSMHELPRPAKWLVCG